MAVSHNLPSGFTNMWFMLGGGAAPHCFLVEVMLHTYITTSTLQLLQLKMAAALTPQVQCMLHNHPMMISQNLNLQLKLAFCLVQAWTMHISSILVHACGVISDRVIRSAATCTQVWVYPAGHLQFPATGVPLSNLINRQ